ncbi:MAG TPA: response regulator [Candidatus Krumholzibacteria bacterium]|nr:response regulator [Candidatus Krumholzibacteria bacterium]
MIQIVLIEDDGLMREWLGRSLASRGHEVVRYRRADEAIEDILVNPPDVVVSDIHMPGMSGLELGQALRARGITVPLVYMTADPTDALEDMAAAVGARRLLRKPFAEVSDFWMAVEEAAATSERTPDEDVTEASHALRTPLTAVRMALEGLTADRVMDDEDRRLADIASRNLDRLTAALEDHLARLSMIVERRTPVD